MNAWIEGGMITALQHSKAPVAQFIWKMAGGGPGFRSGRLPFGLRLSKAARRADPRESVVAHHRCDRSQGPRADGGRYDTVQPKAVAHPTDAGLPHRAITKLVGFAERNPVPLPQSYLRRVRRHHGRPLKATLISSSAPA